MANLRESIMEATTTLLRGISRGEGYQTSPIFVTREFAGMPELKAGQVALFIEDGEELRDIIEAPAGSVNSTFTVMIRGYAQDPTGTTELINRVIYDVKKAIQAAGGNLGVAAQQSGQAEIWNALITKIEVDMDRETNIAQAVFTLETKYREPRLLA